MEWSTAEALATLIGVGDSNCLALFPLLEQNQKTADKRILLDLPLKKAITRTKLELESQIQTWNLLRLMLTLPYVSPPPSPLGRKVTFDKQLNPQFDNP